jgi:hypothetical protein
MPEAADKYVVVCNYCEGTSYCSPGALAYVTHTGGMFSFDGRLQVFARSRRGRWILRWERISRLHNFRVKSLPSEHPRYSDVGTVAHDTRRSAEKQLDYIRRWEPEFVEHEPAEHQTRQSNVRKVAAVISEPRSTEYASDPRVDTYIDALPQWQQEICREVRALVHAADPEITETIKRTRQPYFVLQGNVCALLAAKDHVNIFLYDGGIVPDPERIITGGHNNKTGRTVAVYQGEKINTHALADMLKQIAANNRAGGWRKLKTVDSTG